MDLNSSYKIVLGTIEKTDIISVKKCEKLFKNYFFMAILGLRGHQALSEPIVATNRRSKQPNYIILVEVLCDNTAYPKQIQKYLIAARSSPNTSFLGKSYRPE
jgi:hypothetical protein